MSTSIDPNSDMPPGDELVAYLDGELPPEESRQVEERLAADDAYRQQLRELDQAWEALSVLPASTVDDGFARTTIELVTVAAANDLSQHTAVAARETRRHARWWVAAAIAAMVIGFIVTRTLWPNSNAALLADLPLIQQVDVLTNIGDIEFLRGLSNKVPLEDFVSDETVLDREVTQLHSASADSRKSRANWLESLTSNERADLAARARSFEDLKQRDSEVEKRVRQLAREIDAAPDAERLKKTLVAYGVWLSRRTPGDQEQLREELDGLSSDQQVNRVRQFVRRANERVARELTADEKAKLRKAIFEIAKARRGAFLEELRSDKKGKGAMSAEGPLQALGIVHRELQDDKTGRDTLRQLINQLSPESQDHWERIGRFGENAQRMQLWKWVSEAMQPKWGAGELEVFFDGDEIDNNQRQRLLELPRAEMEAELGRLYLISEFGLRDKGQLLRDSRGAGGMRPNMPGPDRREWRPEGPKRGGPGGPPPPDSGRPPRGQRGPGGMRGPPPRDDRGRMRRPPDGPGPLPREERPLPEQRPQETI